MNTQHRKRRKRLMEAYESKVRPVRDAHSPLGTRKQLALLVVGCGVVAVGSRAAWSRPVLSVAVVAQTTDIKRNGTVKPITVTKGGWIAVISREELRVSGSHEAFWGAKPRGKNLVVTWFRLKGPLHAVFVPASAWAGLCNVDKVELRPSRSGCEVLLVGGDASTSYRCTLVSDREVVKGRTVRHGEFPDERFEKTVYGYVPNDGR